MPWRKETSRLFQESNPICPARSQVTILTGLSCLQDK
jgi:hypothetical protein